MESESEERTGGLGVLPDVRETVDRHLFVMLFVGVIAGYSISVLGESAVFVPVVGSVPGLLLGAVGLAVAAVVYRQFGSGCGCAGDCGDSCSIES